MFERKISRAARSRADFTQLTNTERAQVKLHGARELAEKEIREGPVDPAYARRQAAEWAREGQEAEPARAAEKAQKAERASAPLLPASRDPNGQGRDSLGRGLDERSIVAAVLEDGAVKREREALGHYLQGAYRDPDAAYAALGQAVQREGWYRAGQEIPRDPAQFGELRGKIGWLASTETREAVTLSAKWEHRVEREAKEAETWQAHQQERERRGLPREPQQDRERQRRERGLGFER